MKLKIGAAMLAAMVAAGSYADSITHGGTTINMDFVDIGYAGNVADASGYGAVSYNYRIGQKEVTIAQFAAARTADNLISNGDEGYWNDGTDGTRTAGTGAPAADVSLYEAMKFCNWLTTGDAYSGAYQLNDSGTLTNVNRAAAAATYGKAYVLPIEDEWHKAAYFKSDGSGYSLYANGLNSSPIPGGTNGWNYLSQNYPNAVVETGFGGEEQNGTYDMMGNVFEWSESPYDGVLDFMAEARVYRGGAHNNNSTFLQSSYRGGASATLESPTLGFRVVVISPPTPEVSIHTAIEIEWTSASGTTYQVQYSTNLASTNWFDLGNSVMATNAASFAFDSTRGVSNRFYRVVEP